MSHLCRGGLTPPFPPATPALYSLVVTDLRPVCRRQGRPVRSFWSAAALQPPLHIRQPPHPSSQAKRGTPLLSHAFSLSAHNQISRQRDPLDNSCASPYIGRVPTVDNQRQRLEFLQGTLEVLILRSLRAAPNHAYGISQFLHQQSENEFLVDNGSLYPALQRLLQRRLIAAQWRRSPNGRRAKYYRLTPLGRKQLVAASSKWLRFVEAMGRILAPEG